MSPLDRIAQLNARVAELENANALLRSQLADGQEQAKRDSKTIAHLNQECPDCEEPAPTCEHCGGDGCIDYLDGDGGDWGEDCPSEENHLIICRHCGGTGYAK